MMLYACIAIGIRCISDIRSMEEEKNSYALVNVAQNKSPHQKDIWKDKIVAALSADAPTTDAYAYQFQSLSSSEGIYLYDDLYSHIKSLIPVPQHIYDDLCNLHAINQFENAALSIMAPIHQETSNRAFITHKNKEHITKEFEQEFPRDKLYITPHRLYFTRPLVLTKFKLFCTERKKPTLPKFSFFFALDPVTQTVHWIRPPSYTNGLIHYEKVPLNYSIKSELVRKVFKQYLVKVRYATPEKKSDHAETNNKSETCTVM